MSNFKNFSKSVKKSLCVLASASSIFSILPTAMAMGGCNTRFKQKQESLRKKYSKNEYEKFLKDKPENFKKLVEYFNIHGTKCAEFYKYHLSDIDNQVSIKEKELGKGEIAYLKMDSGYTEKKLSIQKEMFEKYYVANCRIGTAAVLLKAKELGLTSHRIDMFECNEKNIFIYNVHTAHSFAVVELDGKDYIFDISREMGFHVKNSNYMICPMCINREEWIKNFSKLVNDHEGEKFKYFLIDTETWKKINFTQQDIIISDVTEDEKIIFQFENQIKK